jgi:NADPH-dependent ferric siderophore reductase
MDEAKRQRRVLETTVADTSWLTAGMVRVVVTGEDLAEFGAGEFTDHYVKLQLEKVRTFTVSGFDRERLRLTLDFVVHGDSGVAGPWAMRAKRGDTLRLMGPGGAYSPYPHAGWHLMVGDPSVIPAISASLRRAPEGVPVHVVLKAGGPEERQPLETPGDLRTSWILGAPGPEREEAVLAAVRSIDLPAESVHAFVHGEASSVRAVRRHLLVDRGVPREALSASGYWKRRRTEEGWREDKAEWLRQAELDTQEVAAATG